MICKNCGKQIGDTAVFCRYCGEKVEDMASVCQTPSVNTDIVDSSSKKKTLGIFTCILAVTTVVFAIMFFSSKSQNSELTKEISKLNFYIDQYDIEVQDLKSECEELKLDIEDKTLPAETYNTIMEFIKSDRGRLYNHYKNFYTASPVVFVKKGKTLEINLSSSYYGTFWADSSELDNCRGEWGSTARVYKVTGKTVGTGIMHFETNSYEDHFYVMVVCYE